MLGLILTFKHDMALSIRNDIKVVGLITLLNDNFIRLYHLRHAKGKQILDDVLLVNE